MKCVAALMVAVVICSCAPAEVPATSTAPAEPPPVATLPPPALGTPMATATPGPPPATAAPAPTDARVAERLQVLLDDWRASSGTPGAVLGVRLADGGTAVVASGETDDAGGFPIEPGHRFRIGSVTKTFVAVLLVQLEDDGLLDLDDHLADHLPTAPHAEAVTLRQLLQHTSGMPDFAASPGYRQALLANPSRVWDASETVELVGDIELDFEPGSQWAYSNTNYVLAGLVAEAVTGQELADVLHRRITAPLGLRSTFLEGLEQAPPIETAGHYDLDGDGRAENVRMIPYTALVTSGAAAGGLSSSAIDVLDFATGLFDGQLLSAAGVASLTDSADVSPGYGLGVSLFRSDGAQFVGHAGALPGYTALFAHEPEERITVVALANQSGVDIQGLVEEAFGVAVEGSADGGPVVISSRGGSGWGAAAPARPLEHSEARRQVAKLAS